MIDGGVLIVTDKVLSDDANMNRCFSDFYYDFKRRNNYSQEEISKKREALENVLISYRWMRILRCSGGMASPVSRLFSSGITLPGSCVLSKLARILHEGGRLCDKS